MAIKKKNAREIATTDWSFVSDGHGDFTLSQIQAAAACMSAHQLERIGNTLNRIENHLLSLGSDGIHTAIRAAAAKARRAEKRERAKRKAARAAARAGQ